MRLEAFPSRLFRACRRPAEGQTDQGGHYLQQVSHSHWCSTRAQRPPLWQSLLLRGPIAEDKTHKEKWVNISRLEKTVFLWGCPSFARLYSCTNRGLSRGSVSQKELVSCESLSSKASWVVMDCEVHAKGFPHNPEGTVHTVTTTPKFKKMVLFY